MSKRDDVVDRFIKRAQEFAPEAAAKHKEYRGRRQDELQMWHKWNESKDPEHLEPLLNSMQPMIKSEANKRMKGLGGSISRPALENELRISALKSLHTYDPSKAALPTHVTQGFQRTSGFVNANRNAKYTPGDDVKKFDRYRNANMELADELGRQPTAAELAERLPWSEKAIAKLQRSFSPEVHTDMGDGLGHGDEHARLTPHDAFNFVRSDLSEQEQHFGHMYFPPEGEKQPSIKNIAGAMGIPSSRAYQLKARVETKVGIVRKRQ